MTTVFSKPRRLMSAMLLFFLLTGCAAIADETTVRPPGPIVGTLKFLESYPEETQLDFGEFPEAALVWPTVLSAAKHNIDVASFYFSRIGDGQDSTAPSGITDKLILSTGALAAAAQNGVSVRVLGDSGFQKTYPEALAWLGGIKGIESRVIDVKSHWGGVMHAKYFLVDEMTLYVGSQNWDWRALTQIRELGALVSHPFLAGDLKRIFELDWALAGGAAAPDLVPSPSDISFDNLKAARLQTENGEYVDAILAASPAAGLPQDVPWDLPLLIEMMDSASKTLSVQLLSYNVSDREGNYFADLDNALRRAAARNVKVKIILSNWAKVNYKLHWIQSLAAVKNIEVKFSNIPEHSKGFIPFGRVEHTKYLTADGKSAWVGTSNWSRDYFYSSRNISLFFHGQGAAQPLQRFFDKGWNSPYVEIVDPSGAYQPPKRN